MNGGAKEVKAGGKKTTGFDIYFNECYTCTENKCISIRLSIG